MNDQPSPDAGDSPPELAAAEPAPEPASPSATEGQGDAAPADALPPGFIYCQSDLCQGALRATERRGDRHQLACAKCHQFVRDAAGSQRHVTASLRRRQMYLSRVRRQFAGLDGDVVAQQVLEDLADAYADRFGLRPRSAAWQRLTATCRDLEASLREALALLQGPRGAGDDADLAAMSDAELLAVMEQMTHDQRERMAKEQAAADEADAQLPAILAKLHAGTALTDHERAAVNRADTGMAAAIAEAKASAEAAAAIAREAAAPTPEAGRTPTCEFCHRPIESCVALRAEHLSGWRTLHYRDPAEAERRRDDATREMHEAARRAHLGIRPPEW